MSFVAAFKQVGIPKHEFERLIGRVNDVKELEFTKKDAEREMKALKNMGLDISEEVLKEYSEKSDRNCGNCKWHDDFTGVCRNGGSEHCADFTDNSDVCDCHYDLEDRANEIV